MANLLSTTVNGALSASGRISVTYNTDRYQFNFNRTSASNWWVTNDSNALGLHVNNVGDKFYFSTAGDFYSDTNGWLSTALSNKQNASTAITTSNIGSQSVNYASSAGSAGQVSGVAISGSQAQALKNTLDSPTLPYKCDIYVEGEANKFYPVHFMFGDQDIWRRIIIRRGYSEEAPWDPIGTGVHHGGLLIDWEGNFGGWGGAEYADRLRVYNESYTNVCADMYIYTHSMGYVFMLRGGHALYHIFSDQPIRGYYQEGTPDIAYSSSTLFYDDNWSGNNTYDVYAPRPLELNEVNSSRIDGLRTKKQSLFDSRYQLASSAINTGNIGSQSVASAGNASTVAGLAVHTGRNDEVNKIVRTDANAHLQTGWINTTSGAFNTAINKIYCSDDGYVRYQTPANFISNLGLITTSNIGSQSVTYATSAGSLTSMNISQFTNNSGYITSGDTTTGIFTTFLGNGTSNIGSGYTRVIRNENGLGGNPNYAPILHIAASDTMWQIAGPHAGQTNLVWRSGYAGAWDTPWWTILHTGNYTSFAPSLTGTGASGTWGISVTGNANTATSAGDSTNLGGRSSSRYLYYRGFSTSGDFQTLQSTESIIRFDQVGEINSWSNAPAGVYTYGGVLSLRGDNFGLQIYGSHTGDLVFKTQWNNDQYSGWRNIIHSGNIGSQSVSYATTAGSAPANGGNSSTVAGLSVHSGRNNEADKIVRTDSSGYIQAGWINTTSGDEGNGTPDKFYGSNDNYIRYYTRAYTQMYLGNTYHYTTARRQHTTDTNYWVGTMGWGQTDWNTVGQWGSGFVDSWSNPGNKPPSGGHHVGVQAFHYRNGSTAYGWQMAQGEGTDWYLRRIWGGTWSGWYTMITSDNIASQSVSNSATTSQRDFSGDISTSGMGRFAGWYTGNAATGLAAEIGISGGQAYIIAYNRQSGAYGTLNIESSGANLRISGSTINASSGTLQQGGNAVIHAGNIGSQSVSYATSAGTAGSAGSVDGLTINNSGNVANPNTVTQNQIGYNDSIALFGQSDGGLHTSAYSSAWMHQIFGDFRSGQIAIRGKNSGTFGDWRTVVDDKNIGTYAVPYGNMTSSTGLNDNKLYLRTNGDNNHYIWNAADDWEEIVAYSGTGLRIASSTGVTLATFSTSGNSMNITGNATYSLNSTRLYASDAPYTYGGAAPYYMYMNYDGGSYWELKVSPATPGAVRVAYANSAGNADTVDGYHMNQALLTTSSPTFQEVYAAGWFRTTGHQGLYNPTNNAHFYPNNASYGSWRIDGTRNGWHGIHFDSGATLMMNSNETGVHREGYGWQFNWYNGTLYCYKNSYGGGTQATVLDSSNYTSYTLPRGGSWYGSGLPGSRWGGFTVSGGEIVFGDGLPNAGQMGILIDGAYLAGENNGFWSLASDNSWSSRRGMYWDGTYLNFTANSAVALFSDIRAPIFYDSADTGYSWNPNTSSAHRFSTPNGYVDIGPMNGSWCHFQTDRPRFYFGNSVTVDGDLKRYSDGALYIHSSNYNSYAPTLTGGGASGSWGISVTGSAGGVSWANVSSKPATWLNEPNLIQGSEPDTLRASGFYESYLGSGNPTGTWMNYINVRHSNTANGHGFQLGMSYYDNNLWFRSYSGNVTFLSWSRALGTNTDPYPSNMNQYVRTTDDVTHNSTTSTLFLVNGHSDNTKGYRIHNTSGSSVSAMFTNSSNQLVIAAGAVDQINLNKKVYVNGVALGVNIAPSATAGRIDASNDIVAFSSSDERLKDNITPIENALDKVKSLTGVEFDWKPEHKEAHGHEGRDTGIIAQQVLGVMPTAVRTNDTGYLAVRYEKLIGLLIEGMKEQQTQIDELKTKLDGLTK
jgi:hypothetical protein